MTTAAKRNAGVAPGGFGEAIPQVHTASLPQSAESPYASRRRFLILAAMAGWCAPERVTERILQELADEQGAQ
jgi:hypothetical protein